MSFKAGLKHVLRHCWLWPIQFWLRPLDMIDRIQKFQIAEMWASVLGGAIWGAMLGVPIWLSTGETSAIWGLAVAGAGAIATVFSGAVGGDETYVRAVALGIPVAGAGDRAVVVAGVIAGGVGIAIAVAGAFAGFVAGAGSIAYASTVACFFALTDVAAFTFVGAVINFSGATIVAITVLELTDAPWDLYPYVSLDFIPIWGSSLVIPLSLGSIAGLFTYVDGIWYSRHTQDLHKTNHADSTWLMFLWILGSIFALAAWLPHIQTNGLNAKRVQLAVYFALMPPIATGLPFWPLLCLWALWQFRAVRVKLYIPETFSNTLPFQWQTFAYPLPGLRRFLFKLCPVQGAKTAFDAIQKVQLGSLQISQARRAAFALAQHSETALPFCGHVAVSTNTTTLMPFSIASPVARSIAVLAGKPEKEEEQPLRIFVGDYPPKPAKLPPPFGKPVPAWLEEFETSRKSVLEARLNYAIVQLDQFSRPEQAKHYQLSNNLEIHRHSGMDRRNPDCMDADNLRHPWSLGSGAPCRNDEEPPNSSTFTQGTEFRKLLEIILIYATGNVQNILSLPSLDLINSNMDAVRIATPHPNDGEWLIQGWNMTLQIATILSHFTQYQNITSVDARRDFLQERTNVLRKEEFINISPYWQGIGKELAELWAKRLKEEIKQAREWLRLDINLTQDQLPLGTQTLHFTIHNPTRTLAKQLRVTVEDSEGLEWHHREVKRGLLEGGYEAQLGLELETRQIGPLRIAGRLEAEDIAGNVITVPFVFQVRVAEAGKPYQIPPYQPYVMGEGLGEDRTFVGREDLLHWLRGLWLQPQGKPAVALIGQRRIGKTSLLNKIRRDGLPDTGLLPVLVNVQGLAGDYDFLNTVAREMAEHLENAKPLLDRANPYPDFKDFLLGLKSELNGRRFLLMLDEADLIPQRGLGEDLPGFLRGLMQEPQYPVLLLLCGTHALKNLGREYYSILFNTAQFRTVSYMSQAESAQVLQKPAGEWLEYDRAVLQEAFRLTKGQPLLLQSIGAKIIDHFNEETRQGRKRSTFVNFNDLNAAAEDVVKQGNAAFESHWKSVASADHRFLAGLAWATDETDRLQLDIIGIEARLRETRLTIPDGMAFKIAERLSEEEILTRAGPTYRYTVPLYRRWVAWRWPPETVRQESLG